MRRFANLVYASFFARLWLLAFNKPVAIAATIVILALTLVCLLVEMVMAIQRFSQTQQAIARAVAAKVEAIKDGQRQDA